MKLIYKKLLKIKTPVMIYAKYCDNKVLKSDRVRILYPNGKCEYDWIDGTNAGKSHFLRSCFTYNGLTGNYKTISLIDTIKKMEKYDKNILTITKVVKL